MNAFNEQEEKYYDYIIEHTANVRKAYELLKEIIYLSDKEKADLKTQIKNHDLSKFTDDEFVAYCDYFYGERTEEVKKAFDYAWLLHQHRNPHHWQHWLLKQDDGTFKALEMPNKYVVEMVCDWWAFSIKKQDYCEILNWYEKNKETMILAPTTKLYVAQILGAIKQKYKVGE